MMSKKGERRAFRERLAENAAKQGKQVIKDPHRYFSKKSNIASVRDMFRRTGRTH